MFGMLSRADDLVKLAQRMKAGELVKFRKFLLDEKNTMDLHLRDGHVWEAIEAINKRLAETKVSDLSVSELLDLFL